MHVDFGGKGPTPHTQEVGNKEAKGWTLREIFAPSSPDGDVMKKNALMNDVTPEVVAPFNSRLFCTRSSCSPDKRRKRSSVQRTTAVLKKTMTEKNERWEVESGMVQRKQQPTGSSGGQSSIDAWEYSKPEGKWTEVSADHRVLKGKKITWTQSDTESAKREGDLCHVLKKKTINEKREERDRDKVGDKLEAFLARKEEEDEATGLMEEMRKNVVAAQQRKFRGRRRI